MRSKAFGRVLRRLRTEKGFSQEGLAFECGLHRTYISQLERGLKDPSLGTVFKLAKSLEIEPSEFIKQLQEENSGSNS